jgi:4-carboxymuconolactone decarboxylase
MNVPTTTYTPAAPETVTEREPSLQPTFGRYAETPLDQMSPEQRESYAALAQVEGNGEPELPGPLKIWVDNPNLGKAIAPLATHFRPPHHSLSQREREIAVCVIVSKWRAHFSTDAHTAIAIDLGIDPRLVEALASDRPATFDDLREQVIYELATSLGNASWIPRSLYDRAVEVLGHDSITDAAVLMGFYTAISLTLNIYDVPAGAASMKR